MSMSMSGPRAQAPDPAGDPGHEVWALAFRVFGTKRGADFWMTRPNPELGGKTPERLVAAGRADIVKEFLQATLEGDFG
ncbi:MAG: MbcA/ParS/Xre antitoxin family protein [Gemmataceae bacterium]|nr:MbcA/ParS/Xre antitoxin family protein [Gemmataceae bacterium]